MLIFVVDQAGNSAECEFSVDILDDEPPTLVCTDAVLHAMPWSKTLEGVPNEQYRPHAHDNSGEFEFTMPRLTNGKGDASARTEWESGKVYEVKWEARDTSDNVATCTHNVTVEDHNECLDQNGALLGCCNPPVTLIQMGSYVRSFVLLSGCTWLIKAARGGGGLGGCDKLVLCTNAIGGVKCGDCPSGFNGEGTVECSPIYPCNAQDMHTCDPSPPVVSRVNRVPNTFRPPSRDPSTGWHRRRR